ncbi:MAG: 4-hydroxy-tetrahydrodipicolinate reductase [Holosporaceae bacterium]|jgi:4-hydroxy-tetrahydrodipicolinate reductase|nr:4-hydroxy-tetrahydrodipicolinate reductase [Holosporaceae bacterium]
MKIGIVGISGRMGKILEALIPEEERGGGISSATSPDELVEIVKFSDVLVDFSTPAAALEAIDVAAQHKIPIVSGTTGFSNEEFQKFIKNADKIPLLHANNFSLGIQLMALLIRKCSETFPDFDFSIMDKHHNRKKDAPSGTALFLAQQASSKAQIASLREGNIFGEHTCDFVGEHEMLSISHRAFDREIFAAGALKCARWIYQKPPRLYSMQDYLDDVANFKKN